jgi:hypothetical protein
MTFEEWARENRIPEHFTYYPNLRSCWNAAIAEEREACAKVAELHTPGFIAGACGHDNPRVEDVPGIIAETIRMRGINP